MSDVMTGIPVTMSTGTSTGLAALVVLRPRAGGSTEAPVAAAVELSLRDERLRRRELLLHQLELQRRRRARRSA